MKKLIFISSILVLSISCFSQNGEWEKTKETKAFSKVLPMSKGKIVMKDGTTMYFKKLKVANDFVTFSTKEYGTMKYKTTDISEMYKLKSQVLEGAAVGAGIGLLTSFATFAQYKSKYKKTGDSYYYLDKDDKNIDCIHCYWNNYNNF